MKPETGQRIRVMSVLGRSRGTLEVGDVVEVGVDPYRPQNVEGYTWIQDNKGLYGWVTWELADTDRPPADDRHVRSRQRRELKRLNRQMHTVILERDRAVAQRDLALKALLQTREELAIERNVSRRTK